MKDINNRINHKKFYELADKYQIVYREQPNIKLNGDFVYIPEGIQLHEVFTWDYQIKSIGQLMKHIAIIAHLNEDIIDELFIEIVDSLTEHLPKYLVEYAKNIDIDDICFIPNPNTKKFFFKKGLSHKEKMTIVNKTLAKKKIDELDIEEALQHLLSIDNKTSNRAIAKYLGVAHTTVNRLRNK